MKSVEILPVSCDELSSSQEILVCNELSSLQEVSG